MKILLAAINAKYIHSNLGVYSLKAYAGQQGGREIEIGEYTINHQMDTILQDIYRRKPDIVGFSCYIWNITYVRRIVRDLIKVLPRVKIWLGGPEVSYDGVCILEQEPAVTGIMAGEGEQTFDELISFYEREGTRGKEDKGKSGLGEIAGIIFRDLSGEIRETPPRRLLPMDAIPFPYNSLRGMEHRIIYYESSRGCPYSCSYCLSSIDKTVRFRSLELVKRELDFFMEQKVPQVKFVDRTFNCKKDHGLAIWRYLLEKDNGITNFHFEISADLLDEEQMEVLRQMRPGLIQLEIGVQTVNPKAICAIRRKTDPGRLERAVKTVREAGNIHQHLDLIAGLPWEDLSSFRRSFDWVYRLRPDQLQLGFLKVLKGSYMAETAKDYGLCFHEEPPYEVLFTRWISYDEILELKMVEDMVEVYYNSCQFDRSLREMEAVWQSPYEMFKDLGEYYREHDLAGINHSRMARYEILYDFLRERDPDKTEVYRDCLMYDLYLRENVKSRPGFAGDQSRFKGIIRRFFVEEEKNPVYLKGYEAYDSRQMNKMAHIEVMSDGQMILFDYRKRNPLNHNAKAVILGKNTFKD